MCQRTGSRSSGVTFTTSIDGRRFFSRIDCRASASLRPPRRVQAIELDPRGSVPPTPLPAGWRALVPEQPELLPRRAVLSDLGEELLEVDRLGEVGVGLDIGNPLLARC